MRVNTSLFAFVACLAAASPALAFEPNSWICTATADWAGRFSSEIWGAQCVAPGGGSYGQVQAQLMYNGQTDSGITHVWLYAWNGDGDHEKCNGVVSCNVMFWTDEGGILNGPSRRQGQEPGFDVNHLVKSIQIGCTCEAR